jgi:hypothetical protein
MRRLKKVTVEKVIAHHLDHIAGKKVISTRAQAFSEGVWEFVGGHIRKCSMLQRPRAAVFEDPPGQVAISCRKILTRSSTFAKESGKIAESLYGSMGENRNIDPGILLICLCKNEDPQYHFLALLKMDPHPIFRARLRRAVDIVLEGQALPDPQQHLQKFAFVRKPQTDSAPEMLLQDMQARADEVANFFQKHFLRCSFCKDDSIRTKEFYVNFRNWVNQKLKDRQLEPDQANSLMKACDGALHSRRVNVEEFAAAHLRQDQVSEVLDYFAEKGLDTEFDVDHETAARYLKTRKIRLDKAEIKIKEADLEDPEFYRSVKDPDNPEITVVQMRTKTYQILG